jgi:hypothetical protein
MKPRPPVNRQIRGFFVNLRMGDENLCSKTLAREEKPASPLSASRPAGVKAVRPLHPAARLPVRILPVRHALPG